MMADETQAEQPEPTDEQIARALADEAKGLAYEATQISAMEERHRTFDARWTEAIERAHQMPEGSLHSVWTAPIQLLVDEQEQDLRRAGIDPAEIAVPRTLKADADEKKLPKLVRAAHRRGRHLRTELPEAIKALRKDHAAATRDHGKRAERHARRKDGEP